MPRRKKAKSRRRSRAHSGTRTDRTAAAPAPAPTADVHHVALDGACSHALETLSAALAVLRTHICDADQQTMTPVHVAARMYVNLTPAADSAWALAGLLLRTATGGGTDPATALDDAGLSLAEVATDLGSGPVPEQPAAGTARPSGPATPADLGDAALLLHEVALEEMDAEVQLLVDTHGSASLAWRPIAPESALVELMEPLLDAAEHLTELDQLLDFERVAAAWWFERWTHGVRAAHGNAFPSAVRCREWALADRIMLATGEPFIAALARPPLSDHIPPKQRLLARAYARAHTGFFTVVECRGHRLTLRDVEDDRTFTVHEHNTDVGYRVGYVVAGRLLPIGDGLFLRSPGTVAYAPRRPDEAVELRDVVTKAFALMHDRAIALEALLSVMVFGEKRPRWIAPAPSKREAATQARDLQQTLAAAGLRRSVAPADAPPELRERAAGSPDREFVSFDVDESVAEYFSALCQQAGVPPGAAGGR